MIDHARSRGAIPGGATCAIGLMSGTSADGIDGVLLALKSFRQVAVKATVHIPFPDETRQRIEHAITCKTLDTDQLGRLDTHLGHLYAQAANRLREESEWSEESAVAVIGCHGQTIRHRPDGEFPFTLQLGNGAIVAQRTGIPVVTDFRSGDVAVGGQGAPLAPAFHHAAFAHHGENRAVVNLGGIANITHLPAGRNPTVVGFDAGPGNTLLDGWCRNHFKTPFDHHGERAAAGTVQRKFLKHLLADPYFAQPPPKSTGREYFNQAWLARALAASDAFASLPPPDILATLTALTAETVASQLNRLTPAVESVYVCGGGVRNRTLMALLAERCDGRFHTTAELGIDPQWVEAAAFAWLACNTLHRIPATLPTVTGAIRPTVAGAIHFPD